MIAVFEAQCIPLYRRVSENRSNWFSVRYKSCGTSYSYAVMNLSIFFLINLMGVVRRALQ